MYNTEIAIKLDILRHLHFYFFNVLFFQKMKGTLRWLKAPFIFLGTIVEPVFEHVRFRFREPIFRRFETSPVLLF